MNEPAPSLVVNSASTSHESIVELNETDNLSGLDESKGDRPVAQTHRSVRNDECSSVDSDASSIVYVYHTHLTLPTIYFV